MSSEQDHTLTNIPGAVLNAVLVSGKFNICHGNAQSLCARKMNKLDEVRLALIKSKVEIACFTESWLTSNNSDRSVAIDGFSVVRNDRSYRRGGGIIVYYRSHLTCYKVFNTTLTQSTEDKTECLALEFRVDGSRILLMVVYNPPENNCSLFMEEKIAEFSRRYESIVVVGDFNTNMLESSRKRIQFESVLQTFSMFSVSGEPTFFHDRGCSQLDLLITSSSVNTLRFGQVSFPGLSQHDLIFGSIDIDVTRSTLTRTYRDYLHFDEQLVYNSIHSVPWDEFYACEDADQLLNFFNENVKRVHDRCIPLRTSKNRRKCNPWFTVDVRRTLLDRDLAYKDWLRAPSELKPTKREAYKMLRNRANAAVARAKKQYTENFLDSRIQSGELWKRVRRLGIGKDKTVPVCDFDPDEINRVFLENHNNNQTHNSDGITIASAQSAFSFRAVQWWDVVNAIKSIKSNAIGLDGLPIAFLKIILPWTVQHITYMFNQFIETSSFPSGWKHAKILPLRKKPHVNTLTNLRPISILCALSKAFEKVLQWQMSAHIDQNRLLSEYQAGFRKGHSCKTAVLRVQDDIGSVLDRKGVGILLLLDLTKAFDTVSHLKLCSKLVTLFKFSVEAANLVRSYLHGRRQTVFCDNKSSKSAAVMSGIPQGSVLGPLLFCCFINDLPAVLKYCSIQLYADDAQLYIARISQRSSELIRMMNDDLKRVAEWCRRNGLLINHNKSKALFLSNRGRSTAESLQEIQMEGMTIEWTDRASNLGYIFQADLQWDSLIAQQCGKIYGSLRTLIHATHMVSTATKLKLFKALILPHFLFGDVLHVSPSVTAMNRLRLALNACVRYVYGLGRYDSVSHLQKNLVGCPLATLYAYRSCVTLRRILVTQSPSTLYCKVTQSSRPRRQILITPQNRTLTYGNSFFVRGVASWNMLPAEVKRSTTEAIFKRECLNYWNR